MVCNSPSVLQLLKSMTLSNISDYGNWLRRGFPNVESLQVVGCEDIRHLWQNEISIGKPPQGLHSFTSLRGLYIEDCPCLVSFPDASLFSHLRELFVINCIALNSLPAGMLLECLVIEGCHSLPFIIKGQLSPSLKKLNIMKCEKLQCVIDDKEYSCISSSSTSVLQQGTAVLQQLVISKCPSLIYLSSRGQLPESLQYLEIDDCLKLESIAERFHNNSFLEYISLKKCEHLKSIPQGLHNISRLQEIRIENCSSLVSFPQGGLPITKLKVLYIHCCEKLKALPNFMHSLTSLKELSITQIGTSLLSFPEEGFPANLTFLVIADQNICKPLFEWGLHKLTSLKELYINRCSHAVSFPDEEIGMILPSSLITLYIMNFPKLIYLSSKGFQNLTSLKYLTIQDCPNLTAFPEVGLPSSLLDINIDYCPRLKKHCKKDKGKEWSKIAHIPAVFIDGKSVHNTQEDDDIPFPPRMYMNI